MSLSSEINVLNHKPPILLQRHLRFSVCTLSRVYSCLQGAFLSLQTGPRAQVGLRAEQLSMHRDYEFASLFSERPSASCSSVLHGLKSASANSSEGRAVTKWVLQGAARRPWRTGNGSCQSGWWLPDKNAGPSLLYPVCFPQEKPQIRIFMWCFSNFYVLAANPHYSLTL